MTSTPQAQFRATRRSSAVSARRNLCIMGDSIGARTIIPPDRSPEDAALHRSLESRSCFLMVPGTSRVPFDASYAPTRKSHEPRSFAFHLRAALLRTRRKYALSGCDGRSPQDELRATGASDPHRQRLCGFARVLRRIRRGLGRSGPGKPPQPSYARNAIRHRPARDLFHHHDRRRDEAARSRQRVSIGGHLALQGTHYCRGRPAGIPDVRSLSAGWRALRRRKRRSRTCLDIPLSGIRRRMQCGAPLYRCLSVSQFKLPLQLDTGSFKSVLDVVFDDALASDDLCIPIGEVGLCSKDTDIEVIDDRTVLLLERGSQHAFELFGRLLKFVHS